MSQSEDGDVNRTFMATDSEELVVRNEEFGVDNANFDTNDFVVAATNKELVNLENACVNIDNSSDVIFGSVKHYHVNGNLTIFQNRDASIEGDDEHQAKLPNGIQNGFTVVKHLIKYFATRRKTIKRIFLIVIIIFGGMIITATISDLKHMNSTTQKDEFCENSTNHNDHRASPITKQEWGGTEPTCSQSYTDPVINIVICHTGGDFCDTLEQCSHLTKQLQQKYLAEHYDDLPYNFLIGGDENIYIARGYGMQNPLMNSSISIAIHGNFLYDQYYYYLENTTLSIIEVGVKRGFIQPSYKVYAENQTKITVSPGRNIYSKIKNWVHYNNGTVYQSKNVTKSCNF